MIVFFVALLLQAESAGRNRPQGKINEPIKNSPRISDVRKPLPENDEPIKMVVSSVFD